MISHIDSKTCENYAPRLSISKFCYSKITKYIHTDMRHNTSGTVYYRQTQVVENVWKMFERKIEKSVPNIPMKM